MREKERGRGQAVALRYLPELPAPFIVARGEGRMAERLEAIAAGAGVPVLRDQALAGLLYPLDLGSLIPVELYGIVAKVFAFVRLAEET